MSGNTPDILLFTIPLCGKCAQVRRTVKEIEGERPGLVVEERSLITHAAFAREKGILSLPGLLVRGKPLRGVVSKGEILRALGV